MSSKQDRLGKKWDKDSQSIYESNKSYIDSKQSDKDLQNFIKKHKQSLKL